MKFPWQKEKRNVSVSNPDFWELLGLPELTGGVTTENALGVPAMWAAVQFISGTIAGLPLQQFRKVKDGRKQINNILSGIIGGAANDEMSSFDWLKYKLEQTLTSGRGLTYIERVDGKIINFWPLNPHNVTIKRVNGRKTYEYKVDSNSITYAAHEIIDIPFMLRADMLSSRSPITTHKEVINNAIQATRYGAKLFKNGGVPPYALIGPFANTESGLRGSDDLAETMKKLSEKDRAFLPLPKDHKIEDMGIDPKNLQLEELQRFSIEQVARIYSLPPIFLQDLTHGTYSNTEQQDLHLAKHTIKRWVEQIESEMNLKLFGRGSSLYVEFNLDGLLRGDIKTRYEAYATGIQNGFLTPDQPRVFENWPAMGGKAEELFIQGATVPLNSQSGDQNDGQ